MILFILFIYFKKLIRYYFARFHTSVWKIRVGW